MTKPINAVCVNELMHNYRDFLCATDAEYLDLIYAVWWEGEELDLCWDYEQMNWEFLIEMPLQRQYPGVSIVPIPFYGEDDEQKILKRNSNKLTHGIYAFPKDKSKVFKDARGKEISRDGFYSFRGFQTKTEETGGPGNGPVFAYCYPYDFLVLKEFRGKKYYNVKLEDVEFWLMPLPNTNKVNEI